MVKKGRIAIDMDAVRTGNSAEKDRLRLDEDRYRFLLENSGDILWTIDLAGRWQYVTKNIEKILHFKESDVIGKTIWDIVAPEYHDEIMNKLKKRAAGDDIPAYEVVVIDGFGRRIPFDVKTSPILDNSGKIIGVQGISRDITERKRAEESAARSEEKFRDLVENIHDWIWEADRDVVFTYSSPRVLDLMGYTPEEIVGKSMYSFMEPEKVKRISSILSELIRQHKQYETAEKTMIGKKGRLVEFEMTVTLIYDEQGVFKGYKGICRDITDRKRAEEALRRAYSELESRVQERTEELQRSKAKAELYVDLMSHDINNMNMVAMGYIEMAGDAGRSGEEIVALLAKSHEMLEGSSQLIDNVRKLQRAETGNIEAAIVDLCDIIDRVKKKYSDIPGMDVKINVKHAEKNRCIVMASNLLDDVFSNLVSNSIRHSEPDTPVVIDIELSQVCSRYKPYFRVTVEDHGPGIPDEQKTRLFYRLHQGRPKATSRGLGLYLVKALVDSFGGTIEIEDRVKGDYTKGTRFVIQLPPATEGLAAFEGVCPG